MKKRNVLQRLALAVALMVVAALVVAACGGDDPTAVPTRAPEPTAAPAATATTAPAATEAPTAVPPTDTPEAMVKELTTVRLGLPTPPSVGNMWFDLAKAKGWDHEFGIDLQIERATGRRRGHRAGRRRRGRHRRRCARFAPERGGAG